MMLVLAKIFGQPANYFLMYLLCSFYSSVFKSCTYIDIESADCFAIHMIPEVETSRLGAAGECWREQNGIITSFTWG